EVSPARLVWLGPRVGVGPQGWLGQLGLWVSPVAAWPVPVPVPAWQELAWAPVPAPERDPGRALRAAPVELRLPVCGSSCVLLKGTCWVDRMWKGSAEIPRS